MNKKIGVFTSICTVMLILAAIISGKEAFLPLAVAIVTGISSIIASSELIGNHDFYKKGINFYENRNEAKLINCLKSIKSCAEISILCISLRQTVSILRDPKVMKILEDTKTKIKIYALDVDDRTACEKLYKFYSFVNADKMVKDLEMWKKELLEGNKQNDINKSTYEVHFYSTQDINIPLPQFQIFKINNELFINPIASLYISIDEFDVFNGEYKEGTPKKRLHLKFNTIHSKILCNDFLKILEHYEKNAKG